MTKLQHALSLAERGFYVFPCHQDSKVPVIKDFTNRSTRDSQTIRDWWTDPILRVERGYNIGIACGRFGEGNQTLLVIDIDPKNGGNETEFELDLEGKELGNTLSQTTPTGGRHFIYATEQRLRQGTHVLGVGIDSRTAGGYILGPGSTIGGKPYLFANQCGLNAPPVWIVEALKYVEEKQEIEIDSDINEAYAFERAAFFIDYEAPGAIEGFGGNSVTYRVAARLKDIGVDEETAKMLMVGRYNEKCEPPWNPDELEKIVENAYQYGKNDVGVDAPEAQFEKIEESKPEEKLSPIKELNKNHAYIIIKGKYAIIHETKDAEGKEIVEFWDEAAFHSYYLAKTMVVNEKPVQVTKEWMKHPHRRTFSGIVFKPEQKVGAQWYNLWRGFSYKPSPKGTGEHHESVRAFLSHAKENVCGGDQSLFRWLIGHFAHLVQKPYEKPNTALVFKGKKGTGKTTLVNSVGALIDTSYRTLDNTNDVTNNFNAHLENCLALTMEEAFWSGDKRAEAILKNLITGEKHRIERKGLDAYYLPNLTRIYIIGNDSWLVPASEDERRYAVFNVKDTQRGDWKFFKEMRLGFEAGGYSNLLRFLMDYDIKDFNFEEAPNTVGLYQQKMASLDAFGQWWFESISEGQIMESASEEWPAEISRRSIYEAFISYCTRRRSKKAFFDTMASFFERLEQETFPLQYQRVRHGSERVRVVKLPTLDQCRAMWDDKMKFKTEWEKV